MKDTIFITAVAVLSVLISCQKEKTPAKPIAFSASIVESSDTKVSVDCITGKVFWVAGDEIIITKGTETGIYTATCSGPTTMFTYKRGTQFTGSGTYSATYGIKPIAGTDQIFSQTPGKLIHMTAPSVTVDSASEVNFKFTADCGLLKLNLHAYNKSIKRIYVNDGVNTYKLLCDTAQYIGSAKDFYVALPAGVYTKYIIRASDGRESVKSVKSGREGTVIKINQISKVTFSNLYFDTPVYTEGDYSDEAVKVAGYYWAPVNCGYTINSPTGLFYQWGKKWGFATSGDINGITSTTQLVNMDAGITCKMFIKGNSCWYMNPSKEDTWLANTAYNPCPAGWRVPTYDELIKLNDSGSKWVTKETIAGRSKYSGRRFPDTGNNYIFLPSTGSRSHLSGSVGNNSYGFYWSSSPDSVSAYTAGSLLFTSSYTSKTVFARASGCSIRCIQE